jgi:hypothetical protein
MIHHKKRYSVKAHEGPKKEQTYSSALSLTSALYGMGGQCHISAILPPQKDPVPIVQEAGWVPQLIWTGTKISHPLGFKPRTVQPLGSYYRPADYNILAADSVVKHKFSVRCLYLNILGSFFRLYHQIGINYFYYVTYCSCLIRGSY